MNILIMGAPGSGKGTFSSRLKETYNLDHISTGDLFRENISKGTDLGKEAKSCIDAGHLVPDDIVNRMVLDTSPTAWTNPRTAICSTAIPARSNRLKPSRR